jgi:hypothetical protein
MTVFALTLGVLAAVLLRPRREGRVLDAHDVFETLVPNGGRSEQLDTTQV